MLGVALEVSRVALDIPWSTRRDIVILPYFLGGFDKIKYEVSHAELRNLACFSFDRVAIF
jgi:hypothetical protein